MKLTFPFIIRIAKDILHPNRYALEKYLIKDGKKHPFAIICPGGGYGAVCSCIEGYPYAKKLNELGCSAFVLYYRVREKALYPAPQEDLARALHEILDHAEEWNLDIDNYSVWGSSAGGHLAASFGTDAMGYKKYNLPKPGALVLSYPVITMLEKTHADTRRNLLGQNIGEEMMRLASVEHQVTHDYPPTFLWCGDADKTVDPCNCDLLKDALAQHGIPCRFLRYQGIDHGVGLGEGLACEGWLDEAVAFWQGDASGK